MNKSSEVAQYIYNQIKPNIPSLPEFFFQTSETKNDGLVFRATDSNSVTKYFGDTETYSFDIALISSRAKHYSQLNIMHSIVDELLKLKKIIINGNIYYVANIFLNKQPMPLTDWEHLMLESIDEVSQTYVVNLGLALRKE